MGARAAILAIAALTLLVLSSVQIACADPIVVSPPPKYRAVVEIFGDSDFTTENGVVSGSGAPFDPYIIQGRELTILTLQNGELQNVGYYIHMTEAAFVIRFVNITTGTIHSSPSYGIVLDDVTVGTVTMCKITGADTGISVLRSEHVTLSNNDVSNAPNAGLSLSSCSDSTIGVNLLNGCYYGILMTDALSAFVYSNGLTNDRYGIALADCSGVSAIDNRFKDTVVPYSDNSWTGNWWPGHQNVIDQPLGKLLILGIVLPACAVLGVGAYIVRRRRTRTAAQ